MARAVTFPVIALHLAGSAVAVAGAAFLTWLWPPTDPFSAAGDLSWVAPALAVVVAAAWSCLALAIAAPSWRALTVGRRLVTAAPLVVSVAVGVAVYLRA